MYSEIGCVIVNYNTAPLTKNLALALINYDCVVKVVIVDNCSKFDDYEELSKINSKDIVLVRLEENRGYGFGNNVGIRYLLENFDVKYALVCNPDTWVTEDSLTRCVEKLSEFVDVVSIAPLAKNIDGNLYPSTWNVPTKEEYIFSDLKLLGRFFPIKKDCYNGTGVREVGCISGAFLLFDVKNFLNVGMYDENLFLYCEETLLGFKFRDAKLRSLLFLDAFYSHNHVYKKESSKVILLRLKRTLNSRMYLLKEYYKVNLFWQCVAKASFFIVKIERFVLFLGADVKRRICCGIKTLFRKHN